MLYLFEGDIFLGFSGCLQVVHVMVMADQYSYKNPGNDPVKICHSLACYEVKQGIANSYHRFGIWLPTFSFPTQKNLYC
jgi:hypothetical protein